jgi:chemotaxis protein MotB
MAKKCKCPPEGAPEWVVTFGDMMALLLTFFILIVSLSEIKTEDKWRAILDEIHRAFGMQAGTGLMPTRMMKMSLTQQLTMFEHKQRRHPKLAKVDDPAVEGRQPQVTTVREGDKFIVGGNVTFEPGSADLSEDAKAKLTGVADVIRGYRNKIELRGHAGSAELTGNTRYKNLWALSHDRAYAVMEYLTRREAVSADRFRLIANAQKEPVRQRVVTALGQQPNRRVEVIVTGATVEQFTDPQPGIDDEDLRF